MRPLTVKIDNSTLENVVRARDKLIPTTAVETHRESPSIGVTFMQLGITRVPRPTGTNRHSWTFKMLWQLEKLRYAILMFLMAQKADMPKKFPYLIIVF